MAVHACFAAILVMASIGGAAEAPGRVDRDVPVSANRVLADVNEIHVVLAAAETKELERLIDVPKLKTQIEQKLGEAGIRTTEGDAEATPRLVVHMEGIEVPGGDKHVHRVQIALGRLVTVPGLGNRRIQAEVWQVRPVMEVAAKTEAGNAVSAAVLVQVEVFVGACKAARSPRDPAGDAKKDLPGAIRPTRPGPQSVQAVAAYPFIASKSSSVFHRPDCRWAQNISGDNRIGYRTREEAEQSGKRPCKSCKP